jgi:hypothetical protein
MFSGLESDKELRFWEVFLLECGSWLKYVRVYLYVFVLDWFT